MFDEMIEKEKENIINSICDLVKFPSVSLEEDSNDAPFGEECKKALEYTLNLGKQMGFKTKNIDGYCGYIEFGSGDELVGIIGHLDVVPALEEDGWTTPPFSPVVRDNKIFGRGTIDDKGPVISALYAMKAIANNTKVSKRVRLILGLNEEKASWKCIKHYKEKEEHPSIGFSPDANFPAIYAEKGIMSVMIKHKFEIENMTILEIDCKSNALNVVPKYCSITLKYNSKENRKEFKSLYDMQFNRKIEVQNIDQDTIKIISYGTAAHAAHPELGVNGITNLVYYLAVQENDIKDIPKYDFLRKLYFLGLFDTESPEFLSREDIAYPTEFDEDATIQDESGILTSNVAVLEYENNNIVIKINLRVPVKTSLDEIKHKYRKLINIYEDIQIDFMNDQASLYIEKDSYLVKTLVNIFNKKAGMNSEAVPIGGGTYARAFDNFISYGPTMPGDLDMCHQVDEFIDIDKLMLATKIYAEAIYELSK